MNYVKNIIFNFQFYCSGKIPTLETMAIGDQITEIGTLIIMQKITDGTKIKSIQGKGRFIVMDLITTKINILITQGNISNVYVPNRKQLQTKETIVSFQKRCQRQHITMLLQQPIVH